MRERSQDPDLSAIGAPAVQPVVTAIIPTFDRAEFVEGAIDIVLAQTMTQLEIVVVDGSLDDTASRLSRHGERIRCVRSDHGGPAHARNVGMRAARGKYHLCRAVAVPLMLFPGGTAATRRRDARRARHYLTQCRTHGHARPWPWTLSYAPGPLRRLGVTVFEKIPTALPLPGHYSPGRELEHCP